MQNALQGVRPSHRGIPLLFRRGWLKGFLHHVPTSALPGLRRHISFPGFIPPPSDRHDRTAGGDLSSLERARGAQDGDDLTFTEGLKLGIAQALSKQHNVTKAELPRPGSARYGKWHSLSLDETRMFHEFDVNVSDSTLVREVDQPGNEHDIELWSCLLEFAHRRMGRDGVIMIWQSVFKRRNLYQVDGPLAQSFWSIILNAAVSDENLVRDVVSYARWLHQAHGVQWPQLYSSVISHMLQRLTESDGAGAFRLKRMIIQWHFAMAPSSGPSEDEFVDLMKKFTTSSAPIIRETLQTLYGFSPHRRLYDMLIPHLYNEGHVHLAMKWRAHLVAFEDGPMSMAGRPFLRCVGSYFPDHRLSENELNVAGLVPNGVEDDEADSQPPEPAFTGQNLSYLINRVHGETFGIGEKAYNDNLGAKWFASSWLSVDFAINVIHTMGIEMIGPLSLQAIALREGNAQRVLGRMDQLRQLNIGLPESNYARAIRYHAVAGDDEALQELLKSDIHPDVFDDEASHHNLLADCARLGDWNTYRLVLSTRLAVVSSSRATATNRVLELYVRQGNGPMALKILKDMSSHNVELAPSTSHMVSGLILHELSPHSNKTQSKAEVTQFLDLQVSLCRQLALTRFPPAVEVWQTLLYRLGREMRLSDLERLSLYIIRLYTDYSTSEQPWWIAHMADVPQILRFESPYPKFQRLPRDLPMTHLQHPLRQIFDKNLQSSIIRWGFLYTSYDREAQGIASTALRHWLERGPNSAEASLPPSTFHLARGIRLLAMLRDEGLVVNKRMVKTRAELRLVDLFRGEGKASYEWKDGNPRLRALRHQMKLNLAEAKTLCDEAWGQGELLSLLELERTIKEAEERDGVKNPRPRTAEPKKKWSKPKRQWS